MLTLSLLVWLGLGVALVSFWWHSDGVKTRALAAAQQRCRDEGVQLLDHTLVISKVKPRRDDQGSWCLQRDYRFEFTSTGEQRYQGSIVMVGRRLHRLELEPHIMP